MKKSFAALLICCCVLGLTTRSYALCDRLPNPYVNYSGTWTVQGNGCYATADDASAACEDHELSGIPCEFKAAGGFGLDTSFYITYAPSAQKTFVIYWIDPDGIGDCSSERAAAESECGGSDLYVIDEVTCEWRCIPVLMKLRSSVAVLIKWSGTMTEIAVMNVLELVTRNVKRLKYNVAGLIAMQLMRIHA